jgi:hypothetical protein
VVAEFKVVNWCAFGADRSLIIIGSDKRSTILPGCAFVGISVWHDEQVWRRSAAVVECLGMSEMMRATVSVLMMDADN